MSDRRIHRVRIVNAKFSYDAMPWKQSRDEAEHWRHGCPQHLRQPSRAHGQPLRYTGQLAFLELK